MRPPRLVALLAGCILIPGFLITFFSILSPKTHQHTSSVPTASKSSSGLKALFSFHSPSSFFTPSALISLTDDNSTFFLARPAAFGPLLPSKGFSGQLWVGSGFGEDFARRGGGAAIGAEGELGCSDLPNWGDNDRNHDDDGESSSGGSADRAGDASSNGDRGGTRSSSGRAENDDDSSNSKLDGKASMDTVDDPSEHDGTDEHLQHPRPRSENTKSKGSIQNSPESAKSTKNNPSQHADIQSIQESAEISGKIVLLSRGGCGFLEKAKWVQRRGGTALIVGDDTRGGVLFTMYASGDTSNITIPSLFTSHTTAQLLSSLTSPKRYISDDRQSSDSTSATLRDSTTVRSKLEAKKKETKESSKKDRKSQRGPNFTATTNAVKSTATSQAGSGAGDLQKSGGPAAESPFQVKERQSWLHSVLSKLGIRATSTSSGLGEDSRRPPSSGQIDWILSDDWDEDDLPELSSDKVSTVPEGEKVSEKARKQSKFLKSSDPSPHQPSNGDDFVIGVQDWRDPDLVGALSKDPTAVAKTSPQDLKNSKAEGGRKEGSPYEADTKGSSRQPGGNRQSQGRKPLAGGSITPGSGEYDKSGKNDVKNGKPALDESSTSSDSKGDDPTTEQEGKGWFGGLSWDEEDEEDEAGAQPRKGLVEETSSSPDSETSTGAVEGMAQMEGADVPEADEHEGLWVTLTPTNMSSSPFFDTLLVLVVSPLVTLSVVYSLLLLRSRIRRRRWRAPKAVVERLPVRTYHTLSSPTNTISSRFASSNTTSPDSPLLQSSPSTSRSRPRSQTTSAVPPDSEVPRSRPILIQESPLANEAEKPGMASSEWRRRYTGKQVECVVCLEEYVDGISRVMSLPCGHEFHADCITPWLTTRRRTCPICKGDVVRSLAHGGSPPNTPSGRYHDDPEDDDTRRGGRSESRTRPTSTSTAAPVQVVGEESADLERGEGGGGGGGAGDLDRFPDPIQGRDDQDRSPWLTHGVLSFSSLRRLSNLIGNDRDEDGDERGRNHGHDHNHTH